MPDTLRCPKCGAVLPQNRLPGVCPACAWIGAMEDEMEPAPPGPARGGLLPIPGHEVIEEIARGGMGIVYRARQLDPPRAVALKMILPHQLGLQQVAERFRLEARALAELDHPAILPVHHFGEHNGMPWFTMKLATGGSLAECKAQFAGDWRRIAELLATLAGAVQFAHERGVLHRDLKPGNVLFDEAGRAYLSDFGLAKLVNSDHDLTRSADFLGTPHYVAPEIATAGARAATTASDIYALGAILYELLAGHPPFEAGSIPALLRKIVEEEPGRIANCDLRLTSESQEERVNRKSQIENPVVPHDLEVICLKCLAKEPARRYATARDLADDLRRWLGGHTIHARPSTTAERAWRWARRNPVVASLAAALIVILSVAAVAQRVSLNNVRRARDQTEANIRYMLESLTPQLAEVGRSRLTAQVLARLRPYFEEQARLRTDEGFQALRSIFLVKEAGAARETGDLDRARVVAQEALAALGQPGDAGSLSGWRTNRADALALLRDVLRDTHDVQGALRVGGEAVALAAGTRRGDPGNGALAAQLAEAHFGMGDVGWEFDLHDVQQTHYEAGAQLAAELAARPDATPGWLSLHGYARYNLGRLWLEQGQRERAEAAQREYLDIHERLVAQSPEAPEWLSKLAVAHSRVSEALSARASATAKTNSTAAAPLRAEALHQAELGLERAERLALRDPGNVIWQRNYAVHLIWTADLAAAGSGDARSGPWYQRAFEVFTRLATQEPERENWADHLEVALKSHARWYERQQQTNTARALYELNVTNQFAGVAAFPDRPRRHERLATGIKSLASHIGRTEGEAAQVALLRRALDELPGPTGWWRWSRASLHGALANHFYTNKQPDLMVPEMKAALALRLAMFADAPDQANLWIYISTSYRYLGEAQAQSGQAAAALATARHALRWLRTNPAVAQGNYQFRVNIAELCHIAASANAGTPFGADAAALLRDALEQLLPGAVRTPGEQKTREKLQLRLNQLEGTPPAPLP